MGKAGAGFRKPRKKPFISKKDLIYTSIAVAVVVVVIAVLAVVISRDDFIRVRDGKLDMEDNWIIANYSNTSSARYYKIGEVGNAKGFTLGAESANSSIKYIYPEDEASPITVAYVGTYSYNY